MIRHTPAQLAEMRAMYETGSTVAQIAEKFLLADRTVLNRLLDAGVTLRVGKKRPPLSEREIRMAMALYRTGASLAELGLIIKCNRSTLSLIFRKRGMTMHRPGAPRSSRWDSIDLKAMRDQGFTLGDLARKFRVTRQRINQLLKQDRKAVAA